VACDRYCGCWAVKLRQPIDGLANKSQDVRDNLADAVAHGAHEVERYATAAKSDRPRSAR
jgi:hypothetical protein